MNIQYTFARIEKKYLLNSEKHFYLLQKLADYIEPDIYGKHTICNIYYDTDTYLLARRSIEKPAYKEKLRLRSYGIPEENSPAFIEIKKKFAGIVYKRRFSLPYKQATACLEDTSYIPENGQIPKEISYMKNLYGLKAKIVLCYQRIAYTTKNSPDLRITIDQSIRSRATDLSLLHGDYGTPSFSKKTYLMEIKVPGAFPLWLAKTLSDLEIYPVSYSKYGAVYKKILADWQAESPISAPARKEATTWYSQAF